MTQSGYVVKDLGFEFVPLIRSKLEKLKVDSLVNVEADEFEKTIKSYINNEIILTERYKDPTNQNIHSVEFFWGHDHDFGSFKVDGLMGTRHIWMLDRFFARFGVDPAGLKDAKVLDIGCWTGGVSLVLNRLGAKVTAIDEINKYVHALNYQAFSFGLGGIEGKNMSLYEMETLGNDYDIVFCLGVIYHITDPIVGLRRIYNSMRPDAILCIETMSFDADGDMIKYYGSSLRNGMFGWNWFVPSPRALYKMLEDSGFYDIKVGNGVENFRVTNDIDPMGSDRCFAVARKKEGHVLCRAGISTNIW